MRNRPVQRVVVEESTQRKWFKKKYSVCYYTHIHSVYIATMNKKIPWAEFAFNYLLQILRINLHKVAKTQK